MESSPSMRSLRVAWLLPTIQQGYYWQPLLREFARLLPQTMIFTSGWSGFIPGAENAFQVRLLPGYRHIGFKRSVARRDVGYEGYQWVTPWVIRDLRSFRPDVIFTSAFGLWTACALAYKAFARSRVIVLLDGVSPATVDSQLRLPIRRLIGKLVDAATSNSNAGCRYLHDVVRMSAARITKRVFYVPDPEVLRCGALEKMPMASVRPSFLFVGQLIKRKGWHELIEAANLLATRGRAFSVTIVGDGPDRQPLLDRITELKLGNIVQVVGSVPYNGMGIYFDAADVLVLPSHEDTWGMVVSEAMALGKAVLCSCYAGASELVEHGSNGYVFNPMDPAELTQCMEQFIRRPELLLQFGASSRRIIASHTPQLAAQGLGELAGEVAGAQ